MIIEELEKREGVWLQGFTLSESAVNHGSTRDEMTGRVF